MSGWHDWGDSHTPPGGWDQRAATLDAEAEKLRSKNMPESKPDARTRARTDSQIIKSTFWDNMETAGIGFDDRVKVLTALSDALETHCGTLYIP